MPEPELGLVFNSAGELFGYVPGNDMSSRSIEGENPLYLPQAKVYEAACALGPAIVPVWAVDGPFDIALEIERDGADRVRGHHLHRRDHPLGRAARRLAVRRDAVPGGRGAAHGHRDRAAGVVHAGRR